ncbi:hypothetical protein B0H21DRAFT_243262 [Amylocystis lapponica]|nr:hypothetical protein B0H21DRAFT_243262 [Amylocystis lapponica]
MSVDGTQNASSNAPSVSSSNNGNQNIDTRARVMQIMSSTMNGCLDELGYSPAMHQQLQALEIANAQLKTENAKLFSDNANLAHLIYIQNETIAANDHSQSIRELRNHVRLLEGDRQTLLSKYQQAVQEVMALRERLARPRRPSSAPKMPTAPDPRSGGQSSVPQISGHHGQVPVAMRPNMFVPRERYPTETFRQDIPTPRAVVCMILYRVGSTASNSFVASPHGCG